MSIAKGILKVTGFASLFLLVSCTSIQNAEQHSSQSPVVSEKSKPEQKIVVTGSRIHNREMMGVVSPYRLPVIQPEINTENYQSIPQNNVTLVTDNPVSTFSVDVDTGSYANIRRFLNQGDLPVKNAVRLEEMVNYFDYQYPTPNSKDIPFEVTTSLMPTPWNNETQLLTVALKGYRENVESIPPLNLVFLVDVSGSMQSEDKLPLIKKSLRLLTNHLDEMDRVAIVAYAGHSGVVLESTPGNQKQKILAALDGLDAGGGTNGEAGIKTAYKIAEQHFIKKGVNRVLLATDGDFNVGISNREALVSLIESKRNKGIFLNTLGYGTGNYNDYLMEQLADKGNGQYAYIDSIFEAKKVLVDEIGSSLLTIASDVKIQLEFNPNVVHEYRLLGYENRALAEEDFNNDKVDAGEIGAGHTVTAMYEISLKNAGFKRLPERRYAGNQSDIQLQKNKRNQDELGWLKLRYKPAEGGESKLISHILKTQELEENMVARDINFAAAVAAFAQILRHDKYIEKFNFDSVIQLANQNRDYDPYGRKAEFIQLVSMARELSR